MKRDSDNMLAVKKAADISLIVCIVRFDNYCSNLCLFFKNDFKLVLRRRLWVVTGFTAVLLIGETITHKDLCRRVISDECHWT